jgi:hypothetical protein
MIRFAPSAALSVCLLALAACGDDAPSADPTPTPQPDASGTTPDGGGATPDPDTVSDTAENPDTEPPDVAPPGPDVQVEPDTAEVPDTLPEPDAVEPEPDPLPFEPAAACGDDLPACALPYSCIEGWCRLPLAGRTLVELPDRFEILQPEEITNLFADLKRFAVNNRFLAIAPVPNPIDPAELEAEYGAVDLVDEEDSPIAVRWQYFLRNRIVFRPVTPDEGPIDPRAWRSDEFAYDLTARVDIELPFVERIVAEIGFDAQKVTIDLVLDETGFGGTGELRGLLTREEAESRIINSDAELGPGRILLCPSPVPEWELPEDGLWRMSSIFDCNGAELDGDVNDDGTNDSYVLQIAILFEAAALVP